MASYDEVFRGLPKHPRSQACSRNHVIKRIFGWASIEKVKKVSVAAILFMPTSILKARMAIFVPMTMDSATMLGRQGLKLKARILMADPSFPTVLEEIPEQ